ncbi:ABC transporter substrate-binding protein [Rossellomorea vietnamensis]|uniref:ABC transporter substrate-binding protein n=2 Tax=Rossellomorea TaxID=2837508 RepID=A0A5D4KAD3_9BACI|nr:MULTISPECIES: ABC transporter substrate-binding protein [Rossellomorea]TYR74341.1 ABC transporter substrate-binding protein [Rossellomorea vietnamensis]TYS77054.1 ABC transporter substrate-binding protein [Rossellomorea aquimaris]
MKNYGYLLILPFLVITLHGCNSGAVEKVSVESSSEGLTISHAKGETTLTDYPEKVAALSVFHTDYLAALDITPSAAVTYDQDGHTHLPYLSHELEDVNQLGTQSNPDIERLMSSAPDIILGEKEHESHYDTLEKVAPTVILGKTDNWRTYLNQIAAIVGRETKAEAVIAQYDQKADEVRHKLETKMGNESIIFMRVRAKELRVYGAQWNVGDVLYKDLALKAATCVPMDDWAQSVSFEILPECNPDHIILQVDDDEKAYKKIEELKKSKIWANLKAVQNGHIYPVEHWFIMSGPLSNMAKLESIEKMMEDL